MDCKLDTAISNHVINLGQIAGSKRKFLGEKEKKNAEGKAQFNPFSFPQILFQSLVIRDWYSILLSKEQKRPLKDKVSRWELQQW